MAMAVLLSLNYVPEQRLEATCLKAACDWWESGEDGLRVLRAARAHLDTCPHHGGPDGFSLQTWRGEPAFRPGETEEGRQ